jgi:hypothetical protein
VNLHPWVFAPLLLALGSHAQGGSLPRDIPDDLEEPVWVETQVELPAFPRSENLIEFHVGPLVRNRFYVDGSTLQVGEDGVVRYVLVIRTPSGASNVTFEGIRCDTGEVKLYASGRLDGQWGKVRSPVWRPIENKVFNPHHGVLNREYFCPVGAAIKTRDEGVSALRRNSRLLLP